MFKKLSAILILFCFTFISSIKAQNNKIDSLKKLLIVSNSDSNKVNLLNKLTDQFMQLRDSSNTFNYYNQSIALAQKVNFAKGIVSAYRIISMFYYNSTQYNKAIEFSSKSLELSKQLGDKLEESKNLTNMSFSYRELGNFKKAVYYAIEGITLNKCIKNYKGLAACYNTIAIINQTQGNTKKALIFYKMAINLPKSALSPKNKSSLLGNIGVLYRDQKQYDSAMIYFNIAEKIGISSKNEKDLPSIYSNIGECYYAQNKNKEALRYFNLGLERNLNPINVRINAGIYLNIGHIYLNENKLKLAEDNFLLALKLSTQILNKEILVSCYQSLAEFYSKTSDFKKSLFYYKEYMKLKDELFNTTQLKEINQSIANYEIELKEKEIKVLTSEKKQKQAEELVTASKRNAVYFIITFITIIIMFLVAYLNIRKQKNQKIKFTYLLLQSQEEERKRISKELHDGIGQNLLAIKHQTNANNNLIDITINELRNISRNLHPVQLEKLGLKAAIESIIREISDTGKLFFSSEIENVDGVLNSEIQIHIYRIIQECVSNIIKHSNATAARIVLGKSSQGLNITIFDNGKGFDIYAAKKLKSLGLTSIEERVNLIGGKLLIHSKTGETKIKIEIKNA